MTNGYISDKLEYKGVNEKIEKINFGNTLEHRIANWKERVRQLQKKNIWRLRNGQFNI